MIKNATTAIALVPAFNPGRYLRPCVNSLLNQTRRPDRIIIIDDGSTDGSMETIRDFLDSGLIELSPNERNLGRAISMNRRFSDLDADFFVIQDADDIAHPSRVERQLAFMEQNPKLGCSSTFIEYITSDDRIIGRGQLDLLNECKLQDYLSNDEPFGLFCPATIVRASVVKQSNLQFRGQFWPADDIDLWNRIAEAGWQVLAQPERLVQYRIHGNSAVTSSFIKTRMQFEWLRICLRARRSGNPEPDHKQFMAEWNKASMFRRMNRARKIAAKGFYRSGGFAVAEKAYLIAFRQLFAAILLDPSYSVRRLAQQVSKSRS